MPVDRHPTASEATAIHAAVFTALALTVWFTACAPSAPRGDHTPIAYREIPLDRQLVQSAPFAHYAFAKSTCAIGSEPVLPVFLDGDGNSWVDGGVASEDPTPSRPIALDLLIEDPACGIYVSRRWSFGLARSDPRCDAAVWTVDRYSEAVVASLEGAIAQLAPPGRPIVLIGYSGGGLLASHLANRLPAVEGLITLAANLDVGTWVAHHHYTSELAARSLPSPFPLRAGVVQLHVFGALDRVAPASLSLGVLGDRPPILVLDAIDHACCWPREWPRIRAEFQQRIESASRMP